MHQGMGGAHLFVIDVTTNDPANKAVRLEVKSTWG